MSKEEQSPLARLLAAFGIGGKRNADVPRSGGQPAFTIVCQAECPVCNAPCTSQEADHMGHHPFACGHASDSTYTAVFTAYYKENPIRERPLYRPNRKP